MLQKKADIKKLYFRKSNNTLILFLLLLYFLPFHYEVAFPMLLVSLHWLPSHLQP